MSSAPITTRTGRDSLKLSTRLMLWLILMERDVMICKLKFYFRLKESAGAYPAVNQKLLGNLQKGLGQVLEILGHFSASMVRTLKESIHNSKITKIS